MQALKVIIREATKTDFPMIRELALASIIHRQSVSPIRDRTRAEANMRDYYTKLADQGLAYFPPDFEPVAFIALAEEGTRLQPEPVGYILMMTNAEDDLTREQQAYILDIAVKPEYHRKGIGTRLMQRAEEYAKSKGLSYIGLTVATGNKAALSLYKNLGYIEEWRRLAKKL